MLLWRGLKRNLRLCVYCMGAILGCESSVHRSATRQQLDLRFEATEISWHLGSLRDNVKASVTLRKDVLSQVQQDFEEILSEIVSLCPNSYFSHLIGTSIQMARDRLKNALCLLSQWGAGGRAEEESTLCSRNEYLEPALTFVFLTQGKTHTIVKATYRRKGLGWRLRRVGVCLGGEQEEQAGSPHLKPQAERRKWTGGEHLSLKVHPSDILPPGRSPPRPPSQCHWMVMNF